MRWEPGSILRPGTGPKKREKMFGLLSYSCTPTFFPCIPDPKSMGRKKLTGVEEGAWFRDKEVEVKSPMVMTRIPDLFQSPISQVKGEGGQRKGRLGDNV